MAKTQETGRLNMNIGINCKRIGQCYTFRVTLKRINILSNSDLKSTKFNLCTLCNLYSLQLYLCRIADVIQAPSLTSICVRRLLLVSIRLLEGRLQITPVLPILLVASQGFASFSSITSCFSFINRSHYIP